MINSLGSQEPSISVYAKSNGTQLNGAIGVNGANSNPYNNYNETLIDTPVLIIGGGPAGLLFAYQLSKFGVRSLLIEKYPQRLATPKAHALSPRSLEICRQCGLDTKAMRAIGTKRADAYWVNFLTNLSGERIGVLPYERMDPEVLEDTPEMIHNIPQPAFEQFVADQLTNDTNVEIRKGVSYISSIQNEKEVITTVEERATGAQYRIRSRHVVACDGAKSAVRKFLGIESDGEDSYETMMTIHFNADLRPIVKDRVGMLHWITDPAVSGFIIGYDLSNCQVLICNFDAKKHPASSWTEDHARKVVTAAIGQDIPFDVLSYRPWILSRKVAMRYHIGNVFLAGDAAHSFPPTGGLGLNSGIGDVHNLAFKIAAVHQGWGGKKLLETYGRERRYVAEVNSTQSVKNGKKIFSFLKALGTAGIDDVGEARENLYRSIHNPEKQEEIADNVEGQREHFDNLELHIGYVYGQTEAPPHASHYSPKFVPGARLQHSWIKPLNEALMLPIEVLDVSYIHEFSSDQIEARQYSTLDLCPFDSFTLIVGPQPEWAERFETLKDALKRLNVKICLAAAENDFEFVAEGHRTLFNDSTQLSKGGGLLVRPDQHIMMKLTPQITVKEMEDAIIEYLGLEGTETMAQFG